MMRSIAQVNGALLVGAVVQMSALSAQAQDTVQPGPEYFLDFSTGLVFDNNLEAIEDPSGVSSIWSTDVVLGFDSETRTEALSARLGITLETGDYADRPDFNGDFTDPFATLRYKRETGSSSLELAARYRERDNGFDTLDDDASGNDLIVDEGTRSDLDLAASFEIGRNAPAGLKANFGYNRLNYFDTTDRNLDDEQTYSFGASARLDLNASTRLRLGTDYKEIDTEDLLNTFETNTSARIGIETDINPSLTMDFSIGYGRDETKRDFGDQRLSSIEEGPTFAFSIVQSRPNGELKGTIFNEINSTGSRTKLGFDRSLDLPSGKLIFALGLTIDEREELQPIGRINYTQDLKRGKIQASFSHDIETDDDRRDVANTSIRFVYSHEIDTISGVDLNMRLAATEEYGILGTDRRRATLGLAYYRALTEDWELRLGYEYNESRETRSEDIEGGKIYATIGRRFDFNP